MFNGRLHVIICDTCNLSGIFHQVCYTGAGTIIGGVVAGPLGAALGGVVGKCRH